MMLTPNGASSNHPLFGRATRLKVVVGSPAEIEDCEIESTSNIEEAAKIVSKRMATTLANELRRVTELELETA
jgi:hypothetical protein